MFRRSTKLTALLVAAASVASMTPVMAVEKLNQKDGTVKNGVAYEDGKYAYWGYKDEDEDDTGVWYNAGKGSKDKPIEDLEEYEIVEKYGTKYAYVTENGNKDEYLVDLSTGKIADDESAEGKESEARGKLINKLKKLERYNRISDDDFDISEKDISTHRLFKNQFGDVWYQYVTTSNGAKYETSETMNGTWSVGKGDHYYDLTRVTTGGSVQYFGDTTTESAISFTGFFDQKGNFIDVSNRADLKIYSARKNKAVTIEKYGKIYRDEALRVNLASVQALSQDKDNIYALVEVDVDYFINKHVNSKGESVEYGYTFEDPQEGTDFERVRQYYIQKISKGTEKEDDTYVPKTITSYQVDNKSYWDDGDMKDAYDAIYDNDAQNQIFSVVGNVLYTGRINSDNNIKVFKITLGKAKKDVQKDSVLDDLINGKNGTNKLAENNADAKDIDISIAKKSADNDTDTELGIKSVSIDVDGNIWAINEGKIKVIDDGSFKDKYSTDRSYNRLDVYNKDSLIAWDDDDDSYTTVQEGKDQTVSDAKEIDSTLTSGAENGTTVKTGWEQQADGTWVLYDATGNKTTGWANVSGVWYYMDAAGIMKTGWVNDNGTWYYCNASGAMQTGWLNDNGTWYYLQSNGAMKTGWLQDGSNWYYLKSNGAMAANETIDGYYVNASGAWVK